MVNEDDSYRSPIISANRSKNRRAIVENEQRKENLLSPRFRSVAAMAGWDEESLLMASLIVEDTPDRQSKQKKRSDLQSLKSPPTNSRRKRRAQRRSPESIPVTVLNLDEDEPNPKQESEKLCKEATAANVEVEKNVEEEVNEEMAAKTKSSGVSSLTPSIPCLDRLREELSCAICLEICYKPSTTPCGHSFCNNCLSSAADKCGRKCPKCRQLISTGKSCKVNTVLWNTIQLLFPQEVEARKAAGASPVSENREPQSGTRSQNIARSRAVVDLRGLESSSSNGNSSADRRRNHEREWARSRSVRPPTSSRGGNVTRTGLPSQDRDAALALRLQREEFMEAFAAPEDSRSTLATATANLRAMASRAINIRMTRGRRD